MKRWIVLCLLWVVLGAQAQTTVAHQPVEVDGYVQIRGNTDGQGSAEFLLRRLKLWLRSTPDFSRHWAFKIQTTFSAYHREKFFLQDVKLKYRNGRFSLDIGQFVPRFSLQRSQHDYHIAPLERARVINVLIPDGTLGVRDVGLQLNYHSPNSRFSSHLGIFNGYGIKEYRVQNKGFLLTHQTRAKLNLPRVGQFTLGYSLQYRRAENLPLYLIFPDTVRYTGKDVRANLFVAWKLSHFRVQGEIIRAWFDRETAFGYYLLGVFTFSKHQWLASLEKYRDAIPETTDVPFCRLGYNFLLKQEKIRFSLDYHFQIEHHRAVNSRFSLQLQFFLFQHSA